MYRMQMNMTHCKDFKLAAAKKHGLISVLYNCISYQGRQRVLPYPESSCLLCHKGFSQPGIFLEDCIARVPFQTMHHRPTETVCHARLKGTARDKVSKRCCIVPQLHAAKAPCEQGGSIVGSASQVCNAALLVMQLGFADAAKM